MNSMIELDKLIKAAKSKGINFGKGDPYNRLRYYTKIGWLPHMTRKKTKSGDIKGHYPLWALDRLILIEKLKTQGLNNDQISNKVNTQNKLQNIYSKYNTKEFKNNIISYVTVIIILLIFLDRIEILRLGKNTDIVAEVPITTNQHSDLSNMELLASGTSYVPANKNKVFINSKEVTLTSKIYVTFNQNYSPATRFWVDQKEFQKGFYVQLDAPVFDNVEFSWWISN